VHLAVPLVTPQGGTRFHRPVNQPIPSPEIREGKEVIRLAVTISVLTVLAVAVFVLCRYAGLRVLHAAVCILFGFFLASSSFAPDISRFVSSLIRLL
jgi:hypothetical protein